MHRSRPTRRRVAAFTAVTLTAALVPMIGTATAANAAPTELFFSEHVEGSSNNKALEIFNGTGSSIDLTGYSVQMFFNGSSTAGLTVNLTGIVATGDVHVVAHSSAAAAILAQADQTSGSGWFNGDDAIVLRKGSVVVDAIGQIGSDPGTEWGSGLTSTADNTLRRKASVTAGDVDGLDAFDPAGEWTGYASDAFDGLGTHSGSGGGGTDPEPVDCDGDVTAIPAIQGTEGTTPMNRTAVTTEGIVVGDYEGAAPNLRGFYLQDPVGDGSAHTSDGIFVFDFTNADRVKVGDLVRVSGTAGENQGQTQIAASAVDVCGQDRNVEPTDVQLPLPAGETLEQYEGMLVRFPQEMHVTEHYLLGRFGQVTLAAGSRLQQPTSVEEPGAPAQALQAANDSRRVILDDASQYQNVDPIVFARDGKQLSATNTLRGGDTAKDIVGVMTFTWGGSSASPNAYRVRPIGALNGHVDFTAANPRPEGAPEVGGRIQVAGMNVLNYFDTVDGCTGGVGGAAMDCRGADSELEFERQAAKTVAAITKMGAEVVGVVEIENDGYGADSALADLVGRLNAAQGQGTWAYVDVDARTEQVNALGTDAIKVGAIYQPAKVVPVGETAVLNTASFVTGGDNAERNRPALAQAFVEKRTGGMFVAVVNHLKSKGSACGLKETATGQGNCNLVRVNAAKEMATWLAGDPTGTGDGDTLILGDLNSYAMEDPIDALEQAGYTNLIANRLGEEAYSYVFDGQWGYLDHALGSASMRAQVVGVADWHVNADEPTVLDYNTNFKLEAQITSLYAPDEFRNSDHDPVIVGLDLTSGTSGRKGRS